MIVVEWQDVVRFSLVIWLIWMALTSSFVNRLTADGDRFLLGLIPFKPHKIIQSKSEENSPENENTKTG
ncbi:UNVERIFIED_CONTAM: hypothetical protein PYX00_009339 [Menopon gallinae]|uniref:ATP synthase F0 subunit 8 n=1 Tax=Menopon gallinae TaxID=328185 RepID=A0AAW2HAQ2_9NEOP